MKDWAFALSWVGILLVALLWPHTGDVYYVVGGPINVEDNGTCLRFTSDQPVVINNISMGNLSMPNVTGLPADWCINETGTVVINYTLGDNWYVEKIIRG